MCRYDAEQHNSLTTTQKHNTTKQADGPGSVTRRTRVLLLLANFGPFVAIIVTAFLAYAMEQWGVGPDVIGKVPQVRAMRVQLVR